MEMPLIGGFAYECCLKLLVAELVDLLSAMYMQAISGVLNRLSYYVVATLQLYLAIVISRLLPLISELTEFWISCDCDPPFLIQPYQVQFLEFSMQQQFVIAAQSNTNYIAPQIQYPQIEHQR